jgi:hypothetical protein
MLTAIASESDLLFSRAFAALRGLTFKSLKRKMQKSWNRHLIPFPSRNRVSTHL